MKQTNPKQKVKKRNTPKSKISEPKISESKIPKQKILKQSAHMRQNLILQLLLFLSILLLLFLIMHPVEGLAAAREGMSLWLNTLIPTLLPFIILTGVLIHTGGIEKLLAPLAPVFRFLLGVDVYGGYVFLLGMLCGYPMGAKLASDLYEADRISRTEAHYLTTFCNHASPAFVITYLGQHCLKGSVPKSRLFISLLSADLICMLFFRFGIYSERDMSIQTVRESPHNCKSLYNYDSLHICESPDIRKSPDICEEKKETSALATSTGDILDVSIMNGFETITRLGGYILLFSVLAGCVRYYWPFPLFYQYLLLGFTEITTGLNLIAGSGLPDRFCAVLSVTAVASGGLCILAQTRSVLNKELSLLPYLSSKCISAGLTGMIFLVLSQIIQ